MRAFIIPLAVALAGCGGTGFTAGVTQSVNLRFGKITSACNTTGAASPIASGDGSSTSFVHQLQPSVCLVTAQWEGPLIDMAALRHQIANDEPNAEKDLAGLHVKHLDIDVNSVSFRDMRNDSVLNAPDTAYLSYTEVVKIQGGDEITALRWTNDSVGGSSENPNHAAIATPTTGERSIEDIINSRLVSGGDVMGTGSLTLNLERSRISDFVDATDPALQVHLDYDVTGGATDTP